MWCLCLFWLVSPISKGCTLLVVSICLKLWGCVSSSFLPILIHLCLTKCWYIIQIIVYAITLMISCSSTYGILWFHGKLNKMKAHCHFDILGYRVPTDLIHFQSFQFLQLLFCSMKGLKRLWLNIWSIFMFIHSSCSILWK